MKNVHFSPNYEECWNDNSIELFFKAYQQLGNFCGDGIVLEPFQSFRTIGVKKQGPYEHECSFLPTINTTGDVYYCPRYAGKRLEKLGHVSNPQKILLNFRKLVGMEQGVFFKEGFSFICPSNYMENNHVINNFRKFYNMYNIGFGRIKSINKE